MSHAQNSESGIDLTPQDLNIEKFFTTYDVLSLRASLRAADVLLQSVPGYGTRNQWGEELVDVGFILHDAVTRLDGIYKKVDVLELKVAQINLRANPGCKS